MLRVIVTETRGSTPREAGAFMLVTDAAQMGTIGGGQLEWDCLDHARRILRGETECEERRFVLGPQVNQCCGGAVVVRYERVDDLDGEVRQLNEARESWPGLTVFGAGHVGRAVIRAVSLLPLAVRWVDPRDDEFGLVPDQVVPCVSEDWEGEIVQLRSGDGVLVMTPSHTLDALIVAAALERDDLAYVGLIGSQSKRRRFEAGFRAVGLTQEQIDRLVCPIGAVGLGDKRPEIIAAFVAAELAARLVQRPVKGI